MGALNVVYGPGNKSNQKDTWHILSYPDREYFLDYVSHYKCLSYYIGRDSEWEEPNRVIEMLKVIRMLKEEIGRALN